MPGPWVQCLLFFVHEENISDASPTERAIAGVYAFVPHIQHYDHLCQVFAHNGITVLRDQNFDSSLTEAVQSDRVEVMEILVDKKLVEMPKLVVCAEFFNKNILEMVLSGWNVIQIGSCDLRTQTDFDCVFDEENLAILEKLLSFGVNIRFRHEEGGSLLHFAIEKNYEPLIRLLLQNGAEVNAKKSNGLTALHLAVEYNVPAYILDLLIQHGGDVNATTVESYHGGATPLHLALIASYQNRLLVQRLLDNGASVEADSLDGNVLQTALNRSSEEILGCVLRHHPDLNSVKNQKAFRWAVKSWKQDAVRMLENYGFRLTPDDAQNMDIIYGIIRMGRLDLLKDLLKWGAGVHYQASKTKEQAGDIIEELLVKVMHLHRRTRWSTRSFEFFLELADFRLRVFNLLVLSNSCWWDNLTIVRLALESSDLCLGLNFNDDFFHTLTENFEIRHEGLMDMIRRHVVAVAAAHLTVNEVVSDWRQGELWAMLPDIENSPTQEECEMQVAMMEVEEVGDSEITFHDILNAGAHKMVRFLRNPSVVEVLMTEEYKSLFPAYSGMIEWGFRKAYNRRTLLNQSIKMFDFLFKRSPHDLSIDLKEKIFDYCSNLDLLVFINVCEIPASESGDVS